MKLGRIRSSVLPKKEDGIKQLMSHMPPRSWEWECPVSLNQLETSSCVGFAWMHYLAAMPEMVTGVTYRHGIETYKLAQTLDDYPGESYEGSSIRGGVKAVQTLYPHAFDNHRWCFDLEDLILTLGYVGCVVAGVSWYSRMYEADDIGVIRVGGVEVGGHAILLQGVEIFNRMFKIKNSWGEGFGVKGSCWISFDDMEKLIEPTAEFCVPINKKAFALI